MKFPIQASGSWRRILAGLSLLAAAAAARPVEPAPSPASLVVISDDNYPPYIFRDSNGALCGILVDQWALWERKTGVRVDLRAMDWADALRIMREGGADVIDTAFWTEERARLYDFTPPYVRIEVPIFMHESLGGLHDVASLRGFTVGVKAGDAALDRLAEGGVDSLKEYPSYEAIVLGAKNQEIKVFTADGPPAVYYLYKHGLAHEFRKAFVLYAGDFHRAVRKQRPDLLRLVQDGFAGISRREYRAIENKWMGAPFLYRELLRPWRNWILGGLAAVLILASGNVLLSRRVRARTAELRGAVDKLQHNLAARQKAEATLRSVLLAAPVGICIMKHRVYQSANRFWCEQFGYPEASLVGKDTRMLYETEAEWDRVGRELYGALQARGSASVETRLRRRDGVFRDVILTAAPVHPENPSDGTLVLVHDITERKRAEEEKDALKEQLAHAQKLESVARLAGGIAHDFNNNLQAILGFTETALDQVPPDHPLRGDLQEIRKAVERSAYLTRQLQAFARKQPAAPRVLDVNAAVEDVFGMVRRLIGEDIRIEWQPGRNLGAVMMDPGQFDQVVANLCVNARDAIGPHGRIVIETASADLEPDAVRPLGCPAPGAYAVLTVRDDGAGMAPEVRDRIFEPFFTTKPIGRGTGLGLSIVYGIVTQNGGFIRVESELGRGSAFHLYLPCCSAPDSAAEAPLARDAAPAGAAGEVVLVVDDEATILDAARRMLESLGYRVLAAASPADALRLFEAQAERIDLLLSDVIMPDMSGPEMVRRMLKRRPNLKHLFMSGHTANLLAEQGLDGLKSRFIPKPFTRQALGRRVREILAASAADS